MVKNGDICIWAEWPVNSALICGVYVACSDQEYFYIPLDMMLVHHKVTPSIKFTGQPMDRGTARVECPACEPAHIWGTRATASGKERKSNVIAFDFRSLPLAIARVPQMWAGSQAIECLA